MLTAVLAGTPVDTRMGVDVLSSHGLEGLPFPISKDPWRQTAFQLSSPEEKAAAVRRVLEDARAKGCGRAFVYCNSLSAAVDFPALESETALRIVTPMEIYFRLAPRFRSLALVAANAQGLAGIERTLYAANPKLELLGTCLLPVVMSIEAGEDPESLTERFRLPELAEWFRLQGAEALLLGCTHFPYLKAALAERTSLPLVDPAEEMVRALDGAPAGR